MLKYVCGMQRATSGGSSVVTQDKINVVTLQLYIIFRLFYQMDFVFCGKLLNCRKDHPKKLVW